MKTLKRKSDPAIITSDKKKRKIERLTVGDVLEQECDISDFKAHSLVAVVFLQSIDSAGEELLDSFHRQYYDYQYIGLEIIIVTADKVEVVTKLKAEKDYPFAVYSDPCHDISKSYQMLKNDKIKRTILLVTPHLKVVKIIDYFSASYVAKLIKKEAIEFIDLDAKGTEETLESGLDLIVVFFVDHGEIHWRATPGNLPIDPLDSCNVLANRTWNHLLAEITNGNLHPCGTRIHDEAAEFGANSYVFKFESQQALDQTVARVRNHNLWARAKDTRPPVAKYLKVTNIQKRQHVSGLATVCIDVA